MNARPETRLAIRYLPDGPVPWDILLPDQLHCEVVVESRSEALIIRGCYIDVGLIKTALNGLAGLRPTERIGVPYPLVMAFGADGGLPSVDVGSLGTSSILLRARDWGILLRVRAETAREFLQLVRERVSPSDVRLDAFTASVAERVLAESINGQLEVHISKPEIEERLEPLAFYNSLLATVRSIFAEDIRIRQRTRGRESLWNEEEQRLRELERAQLQEAFDAFASRFGVTKATVSPDEIGDSRQNE